MNKIYSIPSEWVKRLLCPFCMSERVVYSSQENISSCLDCEKKWKVIKNQILTGGENE